jgi:periplasmic protein TonB
MPKMSHAIAGWPHHPTHSRPVTDHSVQKRSPIPNTLPDQPGLWRYERVTRSPLVMALAILSSVGLHALALYGFNHRAPPRKVAAVEEVIIQMVMPDLQDDEEKPVESLDMEDAAESPAISVPMLADIPTIVPVNAFVQPLDFTPTLPTNLDSVHLSAVPVNIARGSASAARLGEIFDVSQLDRQPQAIFQPPPAFPFELRKDYAEAVVVLGFIITTKGEVVNPYVISSEVRRFEEAAITGVLKWKFRPGMRAGRPVNTRTQIAITFRVGDGD